MMKLTVGFWVLCALTGIAFFVGVFGRLSDNQQLFLLGGIAALWLLWHNDRHQEWLGDFFSRDGSKEDQLRAFQRDSLHYLFQIQWGLVLVIVLLVYIASRLA